MSEWQPIETAPKDGTVIIAYDGCVRPMVWVVDEYDGEREGTYSGWCELDPFWGGTLYAGVLKVKDTLTHWMPLPQPPEQTND